MCARRIPLPTNRGGVAAARAHGGAVICEDDSCDPPTISNLACTRPSPMIGRHTAQSRPQDPHESEKLVPSVVAWSSLPARSGRAPNRRHPARPDAPARIPVVLDTDIGDDIDDTFALLMLLRSRELDLKLVVTDFGDTVTARASRRSCSRPWGVRTCR